MAIKRHLKQNRIIQKLLLWKNRWITKKTQINLVKNGKDVLQQAVNILDSINVDYWLDYGTLLGAIRNKGFITGDGDIDLGINILEDMNKILNTFQKNGFRIYCYYHVNPETYGRIVSLQKKGIIVDLYNYTISDEKMWCTIYEQDQCESIVEYYKKFKTLKVFYLHFNFKIETIDYKLFDFNVKIPKNHRQYLTTIYGSDYMIEKSNWEGSLNKKFMPKLKAEIKF